MEKHINGWKIAFWAFFTLWLIQGIVIGVMVNKNRKLETSNSLLTSEQQESTQSSSPSCQTAVHQKWDSLIDREMGLDQSIAYQDEGIEQTQLDQC